MNIIIGYQFFGRWKPSARLIKRAQFLFSIIKIGATHPLRTYKIQPEPKKVAKL